MTPAESSDRGAPTPGTPHDALHVPDVLWVRHRGEIHMLPLCPDTRPYSTVALSRVGRRRPGDPVLPQVIVNAAKDTQLTVEGAGTAEDPMFCPQLEDQPLPVCRCVGNPLGPEYVDDLDDKFYETPDPPDASRPASDGGKP
jgi:hypothetical protein